MQTLYIFRTNWQGKWNAKSVVTLCIYTDIRGICKNKTTKHYKSWLQMLTIRLHPEFKSSVMKCSPRCAVRVNMVVARTQGWQDNHNLNHTNSNRINSDYINIVLLLLKCFLDTSLTSSHSDIWCYTLHPLLVNIVPGVVNWLQGAMSRFPAYSVSKWLLPANFLSIL